MSKGIMYIDGKRVDFDGEKNVLAVIRKAGIEIPTFCYYSELSTYGACRMCVVENEWGGIEASCSMEPRDGMKIKTNTAKLLKHRKMILELLLASHCRDCTTCDKNESCKLQDLAKQFHIRQVRFDNNREMLPTDFSSPSIIRDPNKCILCGDCVRVCNEIQGMGILDFAHRGSDLKVCPAFDRELSETKCINCGQCAAVCPTGAITIRSDISNVWEAIFDPNKRVVVQIAPAVRVAIGEEFGLPAGENSMGKLVAALRRIGFNHVFDTTFGADLTVMEEAKEFITRLETKGKFPMFTSCCPAWIRYLETSAPEYLSNISTCKSPMQMFAVLAKAYYKEIKPYDTRETVMVAIMPCTAKKFEAARDEFKTNGVPDVDYVLTTHEIINMIKITGLQFNELEEESTGMPLGMGSGAGVIFGTTGGVAEAVIRTCIPQKDSYTLKQLKFIGVRGMEESVKECTLTLNDKEIRFAVVHGLKEAKLLLKKIKAGECHYDLVEVMACQGGCVGGAGQPFGNFEQKKERAQGLYSADLTTQIKRSEENPVVTRMYDGILKNRTHDYLHVNYIKE